MDLSLAKAMSGRCDFYYIMQLLPYWLKSTALNIAKPPAQSGVYGGHDIPEIAAFSNYLDLDKTFIAYKSDTRLICQQTLKMQAELEKLIAQIKPDIIHFNSIVNFQFFKFLLFNKTPAVLTLHDPIPHSSDENFINALRIGINHRFLKNTIVLNSAQLAPYIKRYSRDPEKTFVSRLGVYEYLKDYSKAENARAPRKSILFFGRIEPYKGVEYLLEAFAEISAKHPDCELVIAGRGKLYWDTKLHEGKPNIKILNRFIDNAELVSLLDGALCCVCPYKDATQSGVMMTSYAMGVPVIASDVGGLSESISDRKTGILVKPCDAHALAMALDEYLSDADSFEKYSANIKKEYFEGASSWGGICDGLIRIYKKILAKK